jgi:hypothetical protein
VASGHDTIVALSSGQGRAAIALVRVSGPLTRFVIETILSQSLEPRMAKLVTVTEPALVAAASVEVPVLLIAPLVVSALLTVPPLSEAEVALSVPVPPSVPLRASVPRVSLPPIVSVAPVATVTAAASASRLIVSVLSVLVPLTLIVFEVSAASTASVPLDFLFDSHVDAVVSGYNLR